VYYSFNFDEDNIKLEEISRPETLLCQMCNSFKVFFLDEAEKISQTGQTLFRACKLQEQTANIMNKL
jgi:hypothetical protein